MKKEGNPAFRMKTLFGLVVLYLIYLAARFFFLRKRFASPGKKRGGASGNAGAQKAGDAARHAAQNSEETALDPVCGNYVPVSCAVSLNTAHAILYFCSNECRDAFTTRGGARRP